MRPFADLATCTTQISVILPHVLIILLQVKDLKRQLKLERKRAEQLQQKLQEALTENRVKPGTLVILFNVFILCIRLIGRRAPNTFKDEVVRMKAIMICKEAPCKRLDFQATLSKCHHNMISHKELSLRLVGGIYMLTIHVHMDLMAGTQRLWITGHWARLDPVGITLEKLKIKGLFYIEDASNVFRSHSAGEI